MMFNTVSGLTVCFDSDHIRFESTGMNFYFPIFDHKDFPNFATFLEMKGTYNHSKYTLEFEENVCRPGNNVSYTAIHVYSGENDLFMTTICLDPEDVDKFRDYLFKHYESLTK